MDKILNYIGCMMNHL